MPRQPEPWFRDGRGWYVQIDRKQIFLGEHPRNAPLPKKNPSGRWNVPPVIWDEFHRRMGERTTTGSTKIPRVGSGVVLIFDAFLDWLQHRVVEGTKARRTYEWYRKYLQSFATFATCDYCIAELTVGQLEPIHVYQWVDSHAGWRTGKRGAMTAVQRALNWAAKTDCDPAGPGRGRTGGVAAPSPLPTPHRGADRHSPTGRPRPRRVPPGGPVGIPRRRTCGTRGGPAGNAPVCDRRVISGDLRPIAAAPHRPWHIRPTWPVSTSGRELGRPDGAVLLRHRCLAVPSGRDGRRHPREFANHRVPRGTIVPARAIGAGGRSVPDALFGEADVGEMGAAIDGIHRAMAEASQVVLGSFELRTDVKKVVDPAVTWTPAASG